MYTEFAGIDYLEVCELLDQSKKGIRPKSVEIDTIYSALGDQTIFSLLRGSLPTLELIYDTIRE